MSSVLIYILLNTKKEKKNEQNGIKYFPHLIFFFLITQYNLICWYGCEVFYLCPFPKVLFALQICLARKEPVLVLSVRGITLRFSGGMCRFSFVQSAQTDCGLHPASSRMSTGVIFVEIKQPGPGAAAHSHLVPKLKNEWNCEPSPSRVSMECTKTPVLYKYFHS